MVNTPSPDSPPSREQLQGSLRTLHSELERTSSIDADSRRLLQQLLSDVQRLLHANPGAASGTVAQQTAHAAEKPSERLEDLAVEFEAGHPVLAGSLRQFIELCSRAGL